MIYDCALNTLYWSMIKHQRRRSHGNERDDRPGDGGGFGPLGKLRVLAAPSTENTLTYGCTGQFLLPHPSNIILGLNQRWTGDLADAS